MGKGFYGTKDTMAIMNESVNNTPINTPVNTPKNTPVKEVKKRNPVTTEEELNTSLLDFENREPEKETRKGRINLVIEPSLLDQVKKHAKRKGFKSTNDYICKLLKFVVDNEKD